MTMTVDKQNDGVSYNDAAHAYWDDNDNGKYISVTTLIHSFAQDFDKNFWSAYKALEKLIPHDKWLIEKKSLLSSKKFDDKLLELYDININDFNREQQKILDDWDKENKASCERGTKIHAELEQSFYDSGDNVSLQRFGVGGKFVCKKDYKPLDLENGVYPEYLIAKKTKDGILRIAGQIDLIVKQGNKIWIIDHKGLPLDTPILTSTGWSTMKDLKVGDRVFDKDGNLCNVTVKSDIHYNPCYKINFSKDFSIIADKDHRWYISFSTHPNTKYLGELRHEVMTTKLLASYLTTYNKRNQYQVPKIYLNSPIKFSEKSFTIPPYILGLWLGDGASSNGRITQEKSSKVWDVIKSYGYELSDNIEKRENVEAITYNVYGLMHQLRELGVLENKHFPESYLLGSINQRIKLLQGIMDADGFYDKTHKRFVMSTDYEWQKDGMVKLLSSLGIKVQINYVKRQGYTNNRMCWDIKFKTTDFNPFLTRNQDIEIIDTSQSHYYTIQSIETCETVPTQCISVDSPSHTYLCTEHLLVTHNTNKEIKMKGGYDPATRGTAKMKYPLNNLDDSNFWHYTLQLSTYAWMLQQKNPNFEIQDLILNYYDHKGNNTLYHCEYLKSEVERMLAYYKKKLILDNQKARRTPIEY